MAPLRTTQRCIHDVIPTRFFNRFQVYLYVRYIYQLFFPVPNFEFLSFTSPPLSLYFFLVFENLWFIFLRSPSKHLKFFRSFFQRFFLSPCKKKPGTFIHSFHGCNNFRFGIFSAVVPWGSHCFQCLGQLSQCLYACREFSSQFSSQISFPCRCFFDVFANIVGFVKESKAAVNKEPLHSLEDCGHISSFCREWGDPQRSFFVKPRQAAKGMILVRVLEHQ